ncbi:MAG: SH3 domain-containing protein [Candidatus Electrothrix sp. GW3-4]|uniref:SH3 domain-containing protein n=1 Tax=Candidatus Electrothrix sp. GW3-4 TaxID=3126740 RepID=UPI0030D21E09
MRYRFFKEGMRVCILTVVLATMLTGVAGAAEFVSVVKDGVNLRSGPTTSHEILFQLPAGYPLKVLERDKKWIKVSDYENDKGWIYAGLVAKTPYVIVRADEGNVRSGPGTNYDKVGKVVRDVILKKVETEGNWFKISHPELTGWIYSNLVWPKETS